MSAYDWYFLGFVLTVIAAIALWGMAIIVYRKGKHSPINTTLAITFLFGGFWSLFGFVENIFSPPSNTLTLWSFRFGYFFGYLCLLSLLLFTITLDLERYPKRTTSVLLFVSGVSVSLIAISPLGIQSTAYEGTSLVVTQGSLYPILITFFLACSIGSIAHLFKKWYRSTGIDRARTNIILFSFITIIPVAICCNFILPAITKNSTSSYYAYVVGVTVAPVSMFYAIVRYRLLGIRIIIRKAGVLFIGLFVSSLPFGILLMLFPKASLSRWTESIILLLAYLILIGLSPSLWKTIERWSAKIFFSGLYDSRILEDKISAKLTETKDQTEGIFLALEEIVPALGVDKLELLTNPELMNGQGLLFGSYRNEGDSLKRKLYTSHPFEEWVTLASTEVKIEEELNRWAKTSEERKIGEALALRGLSACVPSQTATRKIGVLLVGKKFSQQALSATDILFLEKIGSRLGLYLDNYALATELLLKIDEVEKADQFKQEIITLIAHEFRTPITVAEGLSQILLVHWDKLDEEQKFSSINDMSIAIRRLCELSEQVFHLSNFQQGVALPVISTLDFSVLIEHLYSAYPEEEQKRLIVDSPSDKHILSSDLNYLFILLKNLLDNALRFSPVEQPVYIHAYEEHGSLFIQIQDYGKGMPEEELQHVFDPFVRVEELAHHTKGMGLGLYIVKVLSKQLDVKIKVTSVLGEGTTFTLTLP